MNSKAIRLRFGVLLAGILCVASFTACEGEKTGEAGDAKSLAAAVAENLDKIESFSGGMTMDFGASASYEESGMEANIDIAMGMDLELSATLDPAATQMKGTLSFSMMGQDMETDVESYTVEEDGERVSYADSGNGWVRTVQKDAEQEDFLNENIYDSIAGGQAEAVLEEEEAMVNGQAAYVISSELSGSDLEDFMSESFSGTDEMMGEDSVDWGEGAAQIKIFIYKESRLPARVQVDCRDFGRALMEASVGNTPGVNIEISAFDMSLFFDEYNSVEAIQVPEEARSGASEGSEETAGESIREELEDSGLEEEEAGADTSGEETGEEELAPNADGSYTIQTGGHTADITLMDGQEYCYANGEDGYFSSMAADISGEEDFSYIYQLNDYYTLEDAEEEYTDCSWMDDYQEYSNVVCSKVQQMDVDGRTVYWAQVDYVYDSGYGASNIRNLHAWTEVGDILFTVELNNSSYEENVMPTGSQELLAEAIRRVVLK